jgi:hypothetical protein
MLHLGGGIFREVRGWCTQCGEPFSWSIEDKQLQIVLKRFQESIQVDYRKQQKALQVLKNTKPG